MKTKCRLPGRHRLQLQRHATDAGVHLAEPNLNCDGSCINDSDSDGICDEDEILGCTDSSACNYDASATEEDTSCEFTSCAGCMDALACNYDDTATIDDGSCEQEDECGICGGDGIAPGACDCEGNTLDVVGICGGNCTEDADEDGICDDVDPCVGQPTSAARQRPGFDCDGNPIDGECSEVCLVTSEAIENHGQLSEELDNALCNPDLTAYNNCTGNPVGVSALRSCSAARATPALPPRPTALETTARCCSASPRLVLRRRTTSRSLQAWPRIPGQPDCHPRRTRAGCGRPR